MERNMSRERFVELMEDAVLSLPIHLKATLRVVEDPDVEDESRIAIAGALLHVLSQSTAVPGVRGVLQHVGSAMLLRLALDGARQTSPEPMAKHAEDWPELFSSLDEELDAMRQFLGDGIKVLEHHTARLSKNSHQGHDATQCVQDTDSSTWLYDAVHEAEVEILEIDDDEVAREIKGAEQIRRSLEARAKRL